ncbi:serine hydrolase domain-containing protein [Gryllotalpicola sp.]|uniref:serine hydrolase domain-containing protein n=1 Tax=Gryllotalpicola sp. TaxID=1932787 RepID=UPI0026057086|nr:serine hydrolase domain-containing protein [Gryllotalpicola sp.]
MMTHLSSAVDQLLTLGDDNRHPASAIIGVRTSAGTDVAAGGWARLPAAGAPGVPMTIDLDLDLASVTKVASTTALTMRLVAEGELDLAAPVQRYLPDFRGEGKDDVTLEQLLTHTAGLRAWWPLYLETSDRDTALQWAQTLPLDLPPGTAWQYSDLGLILAGIVIERVTSLELAEAFRSLIAEPLGLSAGYGPRPAAETATSSDSDAYEFAMIATGIPYPVPFAVDQFAGWRDYPLRGQVNDGNAAHALGGVAGHAGLFATVEELLILGAALREGDFVPGPVLTRFATPTPIHPEQAVGFRRSTRPTPDGELTLLGHGGFTGTWFGIGLEQELVIAGGAMRLHGTVGPVRRGTTDAREGLVTVVQIQDALLDAGLAALSTRPLAISPELP